MIFLALFLISGTSVVSFSRESDTPPNALELLEIDSVFTQAKANFSGYAQYLYDEIDEAELDFTAFKQGLTGYLNLEKRGELKKKDLLTIVDFSKPSNVERLFIIDLCTRRVIHRSLCAHGANSGGLYPRKFSNDEDSHQSSIGFYVTSTTYTSKKFDLALRIDGKEYTNSHARSRGVVIHAADYATYEFLDKNNCELGRSHGCPAVPHDNFENVVEMLKEGSCFFIYYPSRSYQRHSRYLNRKNYLEDFLVLD